jgi:hypothetical protein
VGKRNRWSDIRAVAIRISFMDFFILFPWTDDGFFVHAFFGFMLLYTSPAHSRIVLVGVWITVPRGVA